MVEVVPFRRRPSTLGTLRLLVIAAAIGLSACGGEVVLPDNADDQIIQGFQVFNARCAQCHGRDGAGGIGLNIQQVENRLTDVEQRAVVVEGRRRMPAFGNSLSEDDIDAVVRFTREIL